MPRRQAHLRIQTNWIAFLDLVCLVAAAAVAVIMRFPPEEMGLYVFEHIDGWMIFFGSIILANYLGGSYTIRYTYSRFNLLVTWLFSLVFALLVLSITSYAWFNILLGRGVLALTIIWYSVFSLFFKMVVYKRFFRSDVFQCRVVILDTGALARRCRNLLEDPWVIPVHKVVAYLRVHEEDIDLEQNEGRTETIDGVAVVNCTQEDFEGVIKSLGVHLVIVAHRDGREITALYPRLRRLRFSGVEVMTAFGATEVYRGKTPLSLLDEKAMLDMTLESAVPLVRRSKRLFDVAVATIGGILCIPLAAIVAVAVKLLDPGAPVLHIQERVGQFGKVFRIYKFRTMNSDAEADTGPVWSEENDPRVTRAGRFLRKCRLDEIPQFVNVLRGNMSLVGPRPERPEIVEKLEHQIPYYAERSNVLPGLTGWAQIRYPYGDSVEGAARKLEYDLYYIKYMSMGMDIQILLSTLRVILFGKERNW